MHVLLRAPGSLVREHHPAHRQTARCTVRHQFRGRRERVPDDRVVGLDAVRARRRLVDDESAADGVVRALAQYLAGRAVGAEPHAVRVVRQRRAAVQHQIVVGERDLVLADQVDPPGGPHGRNPVADRGRVDGFRRLALEAEDHGPVAAVSVAGGAERSEQLGAHPAHAFEQVVIDQAGGEGACGTHRPHGVRAGRPDADREQVEDTDGHEPIMRLVAIVQPAAVSGRSMLPDRGYTTVSVTSTFPLVAFE